MKSSFFYYLILLLIVVSCKRVNEQKTATQTEPIETTTTNTVAMNETNELPCFVSQRVYPETAWIWSQSWTSYSNYLKPRIPVQDSPEFYFKREVLNKLKKKNTQASGVLLFYVLKDTIDKTPSLAMINTVNCQQVDDCEDCVFVNWYEGDEGFISKDSLIQYRNNWKYNDSIRGAKMRGYLPVNGYNYAWKTLDELSNIHGGILVKYGVRTLGPEEILEFLPKDMYETITGNAVFCNILVGRDGGETSTSFRDEIERLSEESEDLDFAKPCPTFCGND